MQILADAIAATGFFIDGGILIPSVDAATGVFAGWVHACLSPAAESLSTKTGGPHATTQCSVSRHEQGLPPATLFRRYFLTDNITPPPSEGPPPYPLVSRLVGKARPGQEPDLMTWQVGSLLCNVTHTVRPVELRSDCGTG